MHKHNSILRYLVFLLLIGGSCASNVLAGEPVVWEMSSRSELLRGEARGVSITDTGVLTLAPQFNQLFNTEQAYVWSTAIDASGNLYLGTGHDGKNEPGRSTGTRPFPP